VKRVATFRSEMMVTKSRGLTDTTAVYEGCWKCGSGKRGEIRRPKKKWNMLNDKRIKACMTRYDNAAYSRIQFLTAVRHSMGAHTEALSRSG